MLERRRNPVAFEDLLTRPVGPARDVGDGGDEVEARHGLRVAVKAEACSLPKLSARKLSNSRATSPRRVQAEWRRANPAEERGKMVEAPGIEPAAA